MRNTICALIPFLLLTLTGFGQRPDAPQKTGEIFGNLIDSLEQVPVEYATVIAFSAPEHKMVKGEISEPNGSFSITGLPFGKYTLEVSFIGYKTLNIEGIELTEENSTYQLKDQILAPILLGTVEVIGGPPPVRYEIDKKIISVEEQINTDGQTAVEVLENIPSVSVGADGTVSLRGSSSFTLLIDGVPTVIDPSDYLATIPANTIKEIEVITNPSAKYDAEGMSGVINIITKKSKLEGVSLLVNGTVGNFGNYNTDFALNVKREKWTFNLGGLYRMRSNPRNNTEERITTYDSVTNRLTSDGERNWRRSTWGVNGDFTWKPNNSHAITVAGNFKRNLMVPYNDLFYRNYDDGVLIESFYTDQHNYIGFDNIVSSFNYQYNVKRNPDHNISLKAIANFSGANQKDTTLSYESDGSITSGNIYTETGPSNSYRFQLDYVLPLNEHNFQSGLMAQLGQSGDIGKNYTYNPGTGQFDFNQMFSSDVDYVRNIHAAYAIFGGKKKELGYQVGLRAEHTFRTISSTAAVDFAEINRLDWFPSAHLSYTFGNDAQMLVSYSRRIERPRSYFFEPFITWTGPFSVRSGNPDLLPTYINAFEINYLKPLGKRGNYSIQTYYRKNAGIIQRVSSIYDEGILLFRPENIGTSQAIGMEPSIDYPLLEWWRLNAGANFYYFDLVGSFADVDYSTQSFQYSARITNTFTIKKEWILQFISRYESREVNPLGEQSPMFGQDVSLKRSFAGKRISLTAQGRNILMTRVRESFSNLQNVYIYSISRPLGPELSLAISIKLNNYQKVYERQEQMDDF